MPSEVMWWHKPRWSQLELEAVAHAILDDLMVDTVLTVRQFQRRHGVKQDLVRAACKIPGTGIDYRTMAVHPLRGSPRKTRPELMSIGGIQKPARVPYLLGLAEMRTLLSGELSSWSSQLKNPWGISRRTLPAAVGEDQASLPVAVDYHYGLLTRAQLAAKHRCLAASFPRVIWGVCGLLRAAEVAVLVPDAEVWCVSWETGEHVLVQKDGRFMMGSGSPGECPCHGETPGPWHRKR